MQSERTSEVLHTRRVVTRVAVNFSDRILLWNEISLDTNALDYVRPVNPATPFHQEFGPHRSSRAMAVVQLAVFEVVNAKEGAYKSYTGFKTADDDWSRDAAVAQAAHDALVALYPPQTPNLDSLLASDLLNVPGTQRDIARGRAVGAAAYVSVVNKLGADNTTLKEPSIPADYQPSHAIGEWDVDPVSQLMVALGGNWTKVTPLTFSNQARFRPPPPPAVGSAAYNTAFQGVKNLGGDPLQGTPTTRTNTQSFLGKFWSYDGTPGLCAPPRLYNQIARQLAIDHGIVQPGKLARFLAQINVAMADAAISAWEAKYFYKYWRPVTGIRYPGQPGQDPAWYPLGAQATNTGGPNITPPFPAYPSGHAVFGGALFEVLRAYVPDATPFTFLSDEFNGKNKDVYGYVRPAQPAQFSSLSDAEKSNGDSRIWLGVHWQFDSDVGTLQGNKVGRHVLANFAQPVGS